MTTPRSKSQSGTLLPRGHTLIELVVAMTSASLLMVGMGGTIYIASQALDDGDSNPVQQVKDRQLLEQLMDDVRFAQSFSERSNTAVTFTVPDRDDDDAPETIRYAWSGTPGHPLTYTRNGNTTVIAQDVQEFSLTAVTRFMAAPVIPPAEGGGKLLFVSGGTVVLQQGGDPMVIPTAQEDLRIALIEPWGYTVTLIHDGDSQANFDAAVAEADVAYVPETIDATALGTKLTDAGIGVVNEEGQLIDDFGLASGNPTAITLTDGSITDNTHYITSPLALGDLALADPWQPFTYVNTGVAPGVDVIGTVWNKSSLMVADTGAELLGGATAAGRRVQLPWGSDGFDFNGLNADAKAIMQRAIEWAAGAGDSGGGSLLLVVDNADSPIAQETARQTLIEAWGYTVTLISDHASQADYDTALADVNVVYNCGSGSSADVGTKLTAATIGVLNEDIGLVDELGIAEFLSPITRDSQGINLIDNTHYVTSDFSLGALSLYSYVPQIWTIGGTLAPGLQLLGETQTAGGSYPTGLAVLETGAELYGGGVAAGRRVQVPWSEGSFDINGLNADGQTILQRAIEWAAGGGSGPSEGPDIYVNDIAMGWRKQGQNYYGQATVWIKDDTGADVVGATVDVDWTGDVTGSTQGVTGPDGKIMLESPGKKNGGTFICSVTDVVKSGSTYNSGLNVETSGSISAP